MEPRGLRKLITRAHHTVTFDAVSERAFKVFVEEFPSWWPHDFRYTKVGAAVGVDGREGGRWYEIDEEGDEQTFGRLLAVESPERLVIAWHLSDNPLAAQSQNVTVTLPRMCWAEK